MNSQDNWKLLTRVPDHVQKESLIHFLGLEKIEVYSPDRDAITQLGNEPQLSLGGYSTFFDGYPIYVNPKDWPQACTILEKFNALSLPDSNEQVDYLRRFQICAIFSVLVPVIFHLIGAFHLWNATKKGQFKWNIRTVLSVLIYLATFMVLIVFLRA